MDKAVKLEEYWRAYVEVWCASAETQKAYCGDRYGLVAGTCAWQGGRARQKEGLR